MKGRDSKASVVWGYFCSVVAVYGIGGFLSSSSVTERLCYDGLKIQYIGVVGAPVLYSHFIHEYLKIKKRYLVFPAYVFAFYFLYFVFFKERAFFGQLRFMFNQFYSIDWTIEKSPIFLTFYITFYWCLLLYSYSLLFKPFIFSSGIKRQQLKYFLIGMSIGWLGSHGLFVGHFGVNIYPFSNFLVAFYPLIVAYAIIKYRLIDITTAITRTTIFVFVYSLVLGIPFALGFGAQEFLVSFMGPLWWVAPLVLSTILATGGPFFYMYLRKSTEDRLYKNQRQYQNTLRKASLGMGRIKDLNRLLNLIVHVVTRTVRIDHCSIYVYHESSGQYVLKAKKGRMVDVKTDSVFSNDTQLVKFLDKIKEPILYDETRQRAGESNDKTYSYLVNTMKNLDAALILPSFVEQRLIAFLVLGAKKSREVYNHEDLVVFSILANQSGLAIENAQFYEDMKKTHEQLFKAEKMATIGTMADGLSHQMNNRLHAMGFIAGDAIDSVRLKRDKDKPQDMKKFLDDLEHSLVRIEDNVKRGGEIAEGLLRYTRKGEEGFSPVDMNKLIDAVLEMIQFKINMRNLDFVREIKDTLPAIKGNFTQLQEAFFNMIDNAYDAMMQRRDDFKEKGYRPKMTVSASKKGKNIEILIQDNGIGVKEEDMRKLFTPFFTTKLSSKKGTGLGLYVIRQIIEENHNGKIKFTSVYKEGSQSRITLPVAEEEAEKKKESSAPGLKGVKTFYKE